MTRTLRILPALALLWAPSAGRAGELDGSFGTPKKEPVYQTGAPRYCLLLFGAEARDRVWLVHDGDILYVDRNADGDLTKADKKVPAAKVPSALEGQCRFKVGELRVGGRIHKGLQVWGTPLKYRTERVRASPNAKAALAADPNAISYSLSLDVEWPGLAGNADGGRVIQSAGNPDDNGVLLFAPRPADAPVVHFGGGPLQITFSDLTPTLKLGRDNTVYLRLGTSGRGPGTFAALAYEKTIPEAAIVQVDAEFPAATAGAAPVRQRYELKERC